MKPSTKRVSAAKRKAPDATVSIVFCDDFRLELGGKCSIMGVYRGFMSVPDVYPALPKFVVLSQVCSAAEHEGAPCSVTLNYEGRTVSRATFNLGSPDRSPPSIAAGMDRKIFASVPIEIVGFQVKGHSVMEAEFAMDGEVLGREALVFVVTHDGGAQDAQVLEFQGTSTHQRKSRATI